MTDLLSKLKQIIITNKVILWQGLCHTFLIWICSILFSLALGFVWGSLRDKRFFNFYVCTACDYLSYIVQGIPFYIQSLIIIFYLAPLLHIENSFLIGIIALGFCSAAYGSQIIKTSYQAVNPNQLMLAENLGYTKKDILIDIIIPQAIPYIIPLYISESDQLLKSTTILSTVGILDFTKSCMNIINQTFDILPVYVMLLCVYLTISLCLRYLAHLYTIRRIKQDNKVRVVQ